MHCCSTAGEAGGGGDVQYAIGCAGEPRDVFDPANKAFLDAISNGECPHELLPEHPGTAINVNMVRKDTDYEPAAQPRHVAFTGRGRTLTGDS